MKILIISLSSLGDIVLTEPVVRILKFRYPAAKIDYLTKPQYADLVSCIPGVDSIILWEGFYLTIKRLNAGRYNLIVDLHRKIKSLFISSLPSLLSMISFEKGEELNPFCQTMVLYNKQHSQRRNIIRKKSGADIPSTVKLYLSVFKKLRIELSQDELSYDPKLLVPDSEMIPEFEMITKVREEGIILVAVLPGATHLTKQYPTDQFAKFISLADPKKYRIFLMGSNQEKELGEEINRLCPQKPINWIGRFSLKHLVAIIGQMDFVISNDSGPMHIAAALTKYQIAIFGATHPRLGFKPANKNAVILQNSDLDCRPCSLHGSTSCPLIHYKCMKSITPELLHSVFILHVNRYIEKLV